MDKSALRRELRQRRRALSSSQQKIAARALALRLASLPALQHAQRIALYWPVDGEIDARRLASLPRFSHHHFYLPLMQSFPTSILRFARWHPQQAMHRNRFNIPEPRGRKTLSAQQMDVILLPLTGFDDRGNRIGMGGGFYDRTLAFKRRAGSRGKPVLIGVAHRCQQVPALATAEWDIGLNIVVTDQKTFR